MMRTVSVTSAPERDPDPSFRTPTFDMGLPSVSLDQALALAAEFEDQELIGTQR